MIQNTANVNTEINLGGARIETETPNILNVLPPEIKKDLEGKKYEVLGQGEFSCIVFPKPSEETFDKPNYFPDPTAQAKVTTTKFLILAMDKTKSIIARLLVFEQLKVILEKSQGDDGDNTVFYTNPKALEDWNDLLKTNNPKEKESCLYKINGVHEFFGYRDQIISTKKKDTHIAQGVSQDYYNKILKENEAEPDQGLPKAA